MGDWSSLPQSVLYAIMQHIPLHQRVGSNTCCALVCRDWGAAAAAATHSLELQHCKDTSSLQLWLSRHGSVVAKFSMECSNGPLAGLPCPELQDLLLQRCTLACRGSQLLHDLAAAKKLRSLTLTWVTVDCSSTQLLALLTALLALEELRVGQVFDQRGWRVGVPCRVLLQLPRLTCLELTGGLTEADLQGLSEISQLQRLQLSDGIVPAMPAALLQLQDLAQLTALHLDFLRTAGFAGTCVTPATLPRLTRLSALRSLELTGVYDLQPSVLSGVTQLQHLRLSGADVNNSAAELLAMLGQMQQLTQLQLSHMPRLSVMGAPLASYSALTASSQLQHLDLSKVTLSASDDQSAWAAVFSPHRPLPQLTALILAHAAPAICQQELESLILACPALQQMDASFALACDAELATLGQLSALTDLTTDTDTPGNAGSTITQLSRLRHLAISNFSNDGQLQQLTALQQLEDLQFGALLLSDRMREALIGLPGVDHRGEWVTWCIINQAPEGSPPDVWQQLQTACDCAQADESDSASAG